MTWVLVIAGAMLGAPLRYLVDRRMQVRFATLFPWGTFVVNVAACLIVGVLAGAASFGTVPQPVRSLIGTGLCGALSSYSTLSYETLRLAESGRPLLAAAFATSNVVASLGALMLGRALVTALGG